MTDCVFCARIEAGQFDYYDYWNVAFRPLNPVTPGHFLVVPRKHIRDALEAPAYLGRAMSFAAKLATDMSLVAANFITSAGAAATRTVWHLHVHVVPRAEGDGLALPWTEQKRGGLRAAVAEDIAKAIEGSVCAPGEQCDRRFCPDCTRYAQCQADAATARRTGGAS